MEQVGPRAAVRTPSRVLEDDSGGRVRKDLNRGTQMIARALARADDRADSPRARDPVHPAEVIRRDTSHRQRAPVAQRAADVEYTARVRAVVVRDLFHDLGIEVGERLDRLVAFAVVAKATEAAIDPAIGSTIPTGVVM